MGSSKESKNLYNQGFFTSMSAAVEGIIHTIRSQRNMRIHFILGFVVLGAGFYVNISDVELMLLCFAVTFVLLAEMFNTAIEFCVDFVNDEYHPLAKIIKDIAAGAVVVSAVNAIVVGYFVFIKRLEEGAKTGFFMIRRSPYHYTAIAILLVIFIVVLIKFLRHEKYIFKGGMPSGHSAVAFAVWAAVSLLTGSVLVSLLVLSLALLIARSRITAGIHNFWEVFTGCVLGALATLLVFQVLL